MTTLEQATHVTAAVLEVLARDQSQQENEVGVQRLTYFLNLAQVTTEKDFRDAIRDWKKQHDKDKVVAVRASEFQTLYYATLHNSALVGKGYKAAVLHGREFLNSLGLRGNGRPILSVEEKEANKNKNLLRQAMAKASKVIDFGQPDALDKLAIQRDIELARLKSDREAEATAKKMGHAQTLIKSITDEGQEYAFEIFQMLGDALGYEIALPEAETLAA